MSTLTWQTATEWDSAQSEAGVVHESVTNTDHNDDTIVKQGYPVASPLFSTSLVRYYPLHEDSGSTAYDFGSDATNGTISGATVNSTGLLSTTGYAFDGVDDEVDIASRANMASFTVACWLNTNTVSAKQGAVGLGTNNSIRVGVKDTGDLWFQMEDTNNNKSEVVTALSAGAWTFATATWDGSTMELWKNATSGGTASIGSNRSDLSTGQDKIGENWNSDFAQNFDGSIAAVMIWDGRVLTSSEIQTLYDIVNTAGKLTTAAKTS